MATVGLKQWDGLLLPLRHASAKVEFPHYRFERKESVMKLIRVGIDLAKNVFQIHGVDRYEKAIW